MVFVESLEPDLLRKFNALNKDQLKENLNKDIFLNDVRELNFLSKEKPPSNGIQETKFSSTFRLLNR